MIKGLYGAYKIPSRIKYEDFCIDVEKTQDNITYHREYAGEKIERLILSSDAQLHINPIEPLNLPGEITPYLLIEFEKPLFVEPRQTREVFLSFPIEIGVYIYGRRNFEIIDILTLARKKLTLYGKPQSGLICKYWKSDIYISKPSLNALHEGILRVKVRNLANVWSEITRIVLNAYGMKIYYDDKMVCMNANMRVLSKTTAETDFIDSPISKKMKKSLELYKLRKLPIVSAKFVMEEGM